MSSMYVVVVTSKTIAPLNDLMAVIIQMFPNDKFVIVGSEDKGYQFRVLGTGDEKAPRKIAEPFLKKWKPSPEQITEQLTIHAEIAKRRREHMEPKQETLVQNKPRRGRPPKKKVYETLSGEFIVE